MNKVIHTSFVFKSRTKKSNATITDRVTFLAVAFA